MEPIIIIRLLITFVLSLFFGLERQRSHKPVGFGTFLFVSLGACALATIAVTNKTLNPVALLAAVVTGIGFLGAGALIRGPDKVFGFTTAAAIWLFAILGLSIGIGEYIIGSTVYALVWVVILFDRYLEIKGIGSYQKKLTIVTNKLVNDKDINKHLSMYTKKHKILSAEIKKSDKEMHLTYLVEGSRESLNKLASYLYQEDWLKSTKVE